MSPLSDRVQREGGTKLCEYTKLDIFLRPVKDQFLTHPVCRHVCQGGSSLSSANSARRISSLWGGATSITDGKYFIWGLG